MKTKNLIVACFTALTGLMTAQVPTSGLLYSWDFNGNLLDGTGNGNIGVWRGNAAGPLYVKDRCGKDFSALHFDGIVDYVKMRFAGPANDAARSISFWMRTDNKVSGGQSIVRTAFSYGKFTTGDIGSRWEICHNYGCQGVGVDISYEYFTSPSTCVDNGKWHHIVVTQAQGAKLHQAKVYIDGVLMPAPTIEPVYPTGMPNCSPTSNTGINATDIIAPNQLDKVITIGCLLFGTNAPGRFYDGDLDDFFLYNRVLTPVEVAQLYAEKCEMIPCLPCKSETVTGGGTTDPPKDLEIDRDARQSKTNTQQYNNSSIQLSDKNSVVLNQNVPNPFAESTVISYNLPMEFNRAQLIFFNNEGVLIKAVDLKTKGAGSITVYTDDLKSGLYSYNLVIDGTTVESKRMIKD